MSVKRKFLFYIAVFVSIYAVIIVFIILPTVKDLRVISKAIYNERVDLEKKYLKGQLLKKTVEDFKKIKPGEERLDAIFIVKGNELTFIQLLEEMANDNEVSQELFLKKGQPAEELPSLPLEITIEGDYLNTLNYLNDLEQLDQYFNIDIINISTFGVESKGTIKMTLEGKIYTTELET